MDGWGDFNDEKWRLGVWEGFLLTILLEVTIALLIIIGYGIAMIYSSLPGN